MIVTETFQVGTGEVIHTYSDAHRYIVSNDVSYSEAYDPAELHRVYTEGELMPLDELDIKDKAAAYDILMGVTDE